MTDIKKRFEHIDIKEHLHKIKLNTVLACGFFGATVGTVASISKYHDAHKGEPVVKLVSAQEAKANEDDPKSLAVGFFATVMGLCGVGLARKENEKDTRKPMNRFIANVRDGFGATM